jgi:pyrroloquinoline quinone biosynthesis protein B
MRVSVLGTAQDGGVPHLGCECARCERARTDPDAVRYPASIVVEGAMRILVAATMDVRHQVRDVDAVVLTHAHVGHLPGLLQFGREVADADRLPVYCTAGLARLVRENDPFALLCEHDCIDLRVVEDGDTIPVGRRRDPRTGDAGAGNAATGGDDADVLRVRRVAHRDELGTGTLAVSVVGDRTLSYVPDVDAWSPNLVSWVADADAALVDGTFWSDDELPRQAEVPHPRIEASLDRLPGDDSVWFTHLNHTNPVLDPESEERATVERAGFGVAVRGQTFDC